MNKVELINFVIYCSWCGRIAEITTEDKRVELFCTSSDCINNSPEYISIQDNKEE